MNSRTGSINQRPATLWASIIGLVLGIAGGATIATPGHARPVIDPDELAPVVEEPELRVAQRGGISLQEAVRIATSRYQGRVIRATTIERGGRRIHEVRILVPGDNRVVTVRIDAQTGEIR